MHFFTTWRLQWEKIFMFRFVFKTRMLATTQETDFLWENINRRLSVKVSLKEIECALRKIWKVWRINSSLIWELFGHGNWIRNELVNCQKSKFSILNLSCFFLVRWTFDFFCDALSYPVCIFSYPGVQKWTERISKIHQSKKESNFNEFVAGSVCSDLHQ